MEAVEPAELAALDDAMEQAGALCVEEPRATTADEPKRPRRGVLQALVNAAEPLPVFRSPGRVEVANTAAAVNEAVQHVYKVGCPAVGFDIEWPVSFVAGAKPKPVALVQIALPTEPPLCYLLHVAHTGITPALRWLLEDENVIKAGVASNQDAQKIMRDFGIACAGIVDLSDMANRVLLPSMRWSLAALVARVLKRTLPKPTGIRIGSWDAPVLNGDKVRYAAQDAFGSLMLWQELSNMPHLPEPARAAPVVVEPAAPMRNPPDADAPGTAHAVFVPAVPAPAVLQPTKAETLRLHASGLDVSQIAAARGLKDITVQNYIADAMCVVMLQRIVVAEKCSDSIVNAECQATRTAGTCCASHQL